MHFDANLRRAMPGLEMLSLLSLLSLLSVFCACGTDHIRAGRDRIDDGSAGAPGLPEAICDPDLGIDSAEITKNEQGVYVLLQLHTRDPLDLVGEKESLLYRYDDRELSLLARSPLHLLGPDATGLWAVSPSEVFVTGLRTPRALGDRPSVGCALELFDVSQKTRVCAFGLLRAPEHLRVVTDELAVLSGESVTDRREVLFEYDGRDIRAVHQLDPMESDVGYNHVGGLWADEDAIYVAATAGVYVSERGQPLERILNPPSPPFRGQFGLSGIYATSPESLWVMQFHENRHTIEFFDGKAWSTVWPPSDGREHLALSGWPNELWGAGDEFYFVADGALFRFSSGVLERIFGGREPSQRNVRDIWGVSADEIYVLSTDNDGLSDTCPSVEVHRFDGSEWVQL